MLVEFARDRSFFMRWGGGGGSMQKKGLSRGATAKNQGKGGWSRKMFR